MKPIVMMSAREQVAERLREDIYTGKLKPGTELIQETISKELGVSRMPVREALLMLESSGAIEIKPNGRAMVKELSVENISEFLELRTLLECQMAIKVCQKATDFSPVIEAHEAVIQQRGTITQEAFRKLNTHFHYAIWELAESPNFERVLKQIWYTVPSPYPADVPSNIERNIEDHGRILKALMNRDKEEAVAAMSLHITKSKEIVVDLLQTANTMDHIYFSNDNNSTIPF